MYGVGFLTLRAFIEAGDSMGWYRAGLRPALFRGTEKEAFEWVQAHIAKHHKLPHLETFQAQFLDAKQLEPKEPPSYYLDHLVKRYEYDTMSDSLKSVQEILTENKENTGPAIEVMRDALQSIALNQKRTNLLNLASPEGLQLLSGEYYSQDGAVVKAEFGWEYLDAMAGGLTGGDVASFVGRPQQGKTFKMLYSALHNWYKKRPILFASMEMGRLPIAQRVSAMHTHLPLNLIKTKGLPNFGPYNAEGKFFNKMTQFALADTPFYVIDGNLALYTDELYALAAMLGVHAVYIDGGYLMKHRNPRLDRYTKVAENVEAMKQNSADLGIPTIASWQFNRSSVKNKKPGERAGLEDIGYSDAIPQISSVVLGLFQEDGAVDSVTKKLVDVLKGRNGEVGQFEINWDFNKMDFSQIGTQADESKEHPADVDPDAFDAV